MIEIEVGRGWKGIVLGSIVQASGMEPAWGLELTSARRWNGLLLIDAAYDKQEPAAVEAFLKWREAARLVSKWTCECCGQPGRLRVGRYRSRAFCEQHAYLCGELLPDYDGRVFDIEEIRFSPAYDDLEYEKWEVIKLWSEGKAPMRDVCDWLGLDRAEVYRTSHDFGFGLHLVETEDDYQKAEELVRLLGGHPDDTKH